MQLLGSAFGRQMAAASLSSAASAAASQVTSRTSGSGGGGSGGAIAFDKYNWPIEHEYGSILHFDLKELKEKRSGGIHFLIQGTYRLVPATLTICFSNFITSCVMSGADDGKGLYSSANIFFSLVWAIVMPGIAMAFTYKLYHGLVAPSGMSMMIAKVREGHDHHHIIISIARNTNFLPPPPYPPTHRHLEQFLYFFH